MFELFNKKQQDRLEGYNCKITFVDGTEITRIGFGKNEVYAADSFRSGTFEITENLVYYYGNAILKVEILGKIEN